MVRLCVRGPGRSPGGHRPYVGGAGRVLSVRRLSAGTRIDVFHPLGIAYAFPVSIPFIWVYGT